MDTTERILEIGKVPEDTDVATTIMLHTDVGLELLRLSTACDWSVQMKPQSKEQELEEVNWA